MSVLVWTSIKKAILTIFGCFDIGLLYKANKFKPLAVYCQFPGYIEHGKVLLVGNMGLYDYRPYVKKVLFHFFSNVEASIRN